MKGTVPISVFEDVVHRNLHDRWGGCRFVHTRWGARRGAPPDHCTLVIGRESLGNWLNVPVPNVPEFTKLAVGEDGHEEKRWEGWRPMLFHLVKNGSLRLTSEIERIMGPADTERLKRALAAVGRYN